MAAQRTERGAPAWRCRECGKVYPSAEIHGLYPLCPDIACLGQLAVSRPG